MTPRDSEELERAWLDFRVKTHAAEEARAALEVQANHTRDYAARFIECRNAVSAARMAVWTTLTEIDPKLWREYLRVTNSDEFGELVEALMDRNR